jgi:hypothetical protein
VRHTGVIGGRMARATRDDDEEDDTSDLVVTTSFYAWEREAVAKEVQGILDALEVPPVDAQVRYALQKAYYRKNQFGGDGRGHIIIAIRCITESAGNENALVEPVASAVLGCLRPELIERGVELIEAFDQLPLLGILERMKGLDLFAEQSHGHYLELVLRNKLARILFRAKPEPVKQPTKKEQVEATKQAKAAAKLAVVEKDIMLGKELLALRSTCKSNQEFGRKRSKRFDIDAIKTCELMRVALIYGERPEIYRRVGWRSLVALSSPSLAPAKRKQFEARILAGESVSGSDIARARGPLKTGRPRRPADQPAPRMAA